MTNLLLKPTQRAAACRATPDSWLNNWPVRRRTNYPLLFDRLHRPKPAFDAVIGVAALQSGAR